MMVCGVIMTMPGLPKLPSSERIDIDASAKIVACSDINPFLEFTRAPHRQLARAAIPSKES